MLVNRSRQLNRRGSQSPPARSPVGEQRGVLLASLLMFLVGWGGLAYLVVNTRPRIGAEIWLFFILLQIAATGTVIPIVRFASLRLSPSSNTESLTGLVVRRSVWIGIIVVACAWVDDSALSVFTHRCGLDLIVRGDRSLFAQPRAGA